MGFRYSRAGVVLVDQYALASISLSVSLSTHINGLCLLINSLFKILRAVSIDELGIDAEPGEEHFQLIVRASIQVGRGNDIVARLRKRSNRNKLRRLTRRRGECGDPALQGGNSLLEDVDGGISNAAVDVAEFLEAEEARAVG